MQRLWNRLRMLLRRTRQEQELQDEIAAHLNLDAQERIDTGTDPAEAEREAHRDFGNVLRIAEDTRTTWGWTTAEQWLQDVRYGCRNLLNSPTFSIVCVLT